MAKKTYNVRAQAKFPFVHAAETRGVVFLSGQPSMSLDTSEFIDGTLEEQTQQCFDNLFEVLHETGLTEKDVIKCTVFITDMRDFSKMNEIYAKQFSAPYPSRSCFAVAGLPLGARVEIEMIAARPE